VGTAAGSFLGFWIVLGRGDYQGTLVSPSSGTLMTRGPLTVVCTSDSHGLHGQLKIPEGDVLVFAGDMSNSGSEKHLTAFNQFLGNLPHRHKIVVSGNHDLSPDTISHTIKNATYLQHGLVGIEGIKIWGTSWQYWLEDHTNLRKSGFIGSTKMWEVVPAGIDMLVTHFPPYEILDVKGGTSHVGVKELLAAIKRIKPRYHVFGHVHESYGRTTQQFDGVDVTFVNVAAIAGFGSDMHPPVVLTF
jgi:Icc-related predicted phosphoesterase